MVSMVGYVSIEMVGYVSIEKEVILQPGETTELRFTMDIKNSSLGEATVTADGFTTGDMEGVTLSPTVLGKR